MSKRGEGWVGEFMQFENFYQYAVWSLKYFTTQLGQVLLRWMMCLWCGLCEKKALSSASYNSQNDVFCIVAKAAVWYYQRRLQRRAYSLLWCVVGETKSIISLSSHALYLSKWTNCGNFYQLLRQCPHMMFYEPTCITMLQSRGFDSELPLNPQNTEWYDGHNFPVQENVFLSKMVNHQWQRLAMYRSLTWIVNCARHIKLISRRRDEAI